MSFQIRKAVLEDYQKIIFLQKDSYYNALTEEQKKKEGFVSIIMNQKLLEEANKESGVIVAIKNNDLIGHEISLSTKKAETISLLKPFIKRLEKVNYKNKPVMSYKTVIGGQICVKKEFKGQGIVEEMHKEFIKMLRENYDLIVTEVSNHNPRSLHVCTKKLGFKIIDQYSAEGKDWFILAQELKNN